MNQIINYVSDFFGIIMRWCYVFVNNYGLSIIVFTIFTKFVLFPISLITQKNSIKMAQMRPELDALKVKYVDDKDRYADAQLELYKKMQYHPLLDMIPLLIQILIVLGLVGVMYCPLSYILRMQDPDIAMLQKWFEGLGWTLQDNSYQLTMIHEIQNGISGVPENLMGLIEKISDFDMNFIGFNLSEKPQLSLHNKLVLIPVLSGVSAWLMCVVQNKINVLQLYAGKWNKIGMTVFMIAFSTYFAFLVPAGVGVYWIFGNLFAIPSMYLVNIVMPPEKYIDMDYIRILNETAEEKENQQEIEKFEEDKRKIQAELKRIAEEEAKKNTTNISQKPSASGYIFPVQGLSKSNINNKTYPSYKGHTGVDVNIGVSGKSVVAVKDGTVVISEARISNGKYYSYGEYIVISHGDGTMTLYAHMLANSRQVKVRDKVKQGQVIGTVGSTGNSTGTHLHFEVRVGGSPVNPLPYLP